VRARFRLGLAQALCAAVLATAPLIAAAAPYAAMVIDARSGDVLHSRNADTKLHPASLTKMMTLYVVFEAVEAGEIGLDDEIRISGHAASEPPSKLGLRAGSTIRLRHLIRAAAVKSANDAATALGEAVSGSEAAFAMRMNRTAEAMGMTNTHFRNAHGLTQDGHLSTARDMTTLGRRLFYDFPAYYNLFSRRTTHAGVTDVDNTNRRLLSAYRGADGIKTGFTRAAGYNLVASAERGSERIIATVFGGTSTAQRNARVAELLDMGFERAPTRAAVRRPAPLDYRRLGELPVIARGPLTRSPRPHARPGPNVASALAEIVATDVAAGVSRGVASPSTAALTPPAARPEAPLEPGAPAADDPVAQAVAASTAAVLREIVHRPGADMPRGWAIAVGRHHTEYQAERTLLRIALADVEALEEGRRAVVRQPTGWEARFVGLTQADADRACRRIRARGDECEPVEG
jgi:D-alanyl-D-alanine carboxypeptidase